jgi:hypothetical protein
MPPREKRGIHCRSVQAFACARASRSPRCSPPSKQPPCRPPLTTRGHVPARQPWQCAAGPRGAIRSRSVSDGRSRRTRDRRAASPRIRSSSGRSQVAAGAGGTRWRAPRHEPSRGTPGQGRTSSASVPETEQETGAPGRPGPSSFSATRRRAAPLTSGAGGVFGAPMSSTRLPHACRRNLAHRRRTPSSRARWHGSRAAGRTAAGHACMSMAS